LEPLALLDSTASNAEELENFVAIKCAISKPLAIHAQELDKSMVWKSDASNVVELDSPAAIKLAISKTHVLDAVV